MKKYSFVFVSNPSYVVTANSEVAAERAAFKQFLDDLKRINPEDLFDGQLDREDSDK